jgi:hypothetical protein
MRFEPKILEHEATKHTCKWNELVGNLELSQGDMLELYDILRKSENAWGNQLLIDIENAFLGIGLRIWD